MIKIIEATSAETFIEKLDEALKLITEAMVDTIDTPYFSARELGDLRDMRFKLRMITDRLRGIDVPEE